MSQIFHRSTNTLSKVSIFGAIFVLGGVAWALAAIQRSSYNTRAFAEREQPVQFSHKHHVGDDGIDCRYCHTSVESSSFAGIPPIKTCMNCHSQLFVDSPYLAPIRESFMDWQPPANQIEEGRKLVKQYHIANPGVITSCSTCHR